MLPGVQLVSRRGGAPGAARGIGRALALRAAAEGATGVVAADLDGEGAERTAQEIEAAGARALGLGADVSRDADVDVVVTRAEQALGPVDVFFANAGVAVGTDPLHTHDATWDLAFAVNIKAHIVAARRLLPGWLERSQGCFVATASAAGLLTHAVSAPYSVTKHAAVAFAEWLGV